jgi:hypothetical protein
MPEAVESTAGMQQKLHSRLLTSRAEKAPTL